MEIRAELRRLVAAPSKTGDRAQAAAHFTAATRAAPTNPIGWRELIRLHLRAGDDEKAVSTARLAQAAIHNMGGVHDEGVVTAIEDGVFRWNPDEPTGWAGYTADYLIYLHPNPGTAGSS